MTISSNLRKAGPYAGNAATTAFPFAYKVFTASDVVVTKSDGVTETTLVLTTDYTVALNADQNANPGGTVTYPASGSPLPVGQTLTLSSSLQELQPTSITNQGGFYPKIIEDALDRLTIFVQQLREILGRSLRFPVSDPALNITLPTAVQRASKVLGFDASGAVVTYSPSSAVTNAGSVNYVPVSGPTAGISVTVQTWLDRLLTAGASLGAALVGYLQAGVGAVSRTVQDKLRETVSIQDFGGSPAVADNYAAALAAYNAVSSGAAIRVPAGVYNFQTAPVFGNKVVAWIGEGSRQSVFNYSGANTTNDCFSFGDGVNAVGGLRIEGIGFSSSTVMTAGAGVRFQKVARSSLRDVLFGHQDGNSNFYHGAWFNAVDFVTVQGFQARAQQDGVRVNGGTGGRADLFLHDGKIASCMVGLHVGGDFGGLYVDSTDIINNATNILIDQGIAAVNNRECIFAPGCMIDTADTTRTATTYNGIGVDIQDTSGFVFFQGTWIATAGTLVRIAAGFGGMVKFDGNMLYNAFNTFGGNGNGIQVEGTNAQVIVNNPHFRNIDGTSVICTAGTPTTKVLVTDPTFFTDVVATIANCDPSTAYNPVMSSEYIAGKFVAGGTAPFAAAVDASPAQTFYHTAALGGAMVIGRFSSDAANSWLEIAKSRGATAGAHALVANGDVLGGVNFSGSDGSAFQSGARMRAVVEGATSATELPTRLDFAVRAVGGVATTKVRIDIDGNHVPAIDNANTSGKSGARWSALWSANGVIQTSDVRTKKDITNAALGLDFINALRPVSYKWVSGGNEVIGVEEDGTPITQSKPGTRTHWGLIAQEVKAACDAAGVDFGGWVLTDKDNPDSQQALRYDQFVAPLIKAVQELTARVQALEAR